MPTTLEDRQKVITETKVMVTDILDELRREWVDITYIEEKAAALRHLVDEIDRDGPMPSSIAADFVKRFEAIADHPETAELAPQIMREIEGAARTAVEVQAIPGVYRHPCRLITFADGSQCAVPSDSQVDRSRALIGLVERYHLPTNAIAEFAVPVVVEPDAVISDEDEAHLRDMLAESYALNTRSNYASQWRQWVKFAQARQVGVLPAHPSQVIVWLRHRAETEATGTIQFALQGLKAVHRDHHVFDDDDWKRVTQAMKAIRRTKGSEQKQADGLSKEEIASIEATAYTPRKGRGGKMETEAFALQRGDVDVAMIRVMREGMLRSSELLELRAQDVEVDADGSALLTIRRSKTDQYGERAYQYLTPATVAVLLRMSEGRKPADLLFPFTPQTLRRRIKAAATAAGIVGTFSGHSPRVGMAQQLAAAGTELPALMVEGRWTSSSMPARYTRRMGVKHRSAIARLTDSKDGS